MSPDPIVTARFSSDTATVLVCANPISNIIPLFLVYKNKQNTHCTKELATQKEKKTKINVRNFLAILKNKSIFVAHRFVFFSYSKNRLKGNQVEILNSPAAVSL